MGDVTDNEELKQLAGRYLRDLADEIESGQVELKGFEASFGHKEVPSCGAKKKVHNGEQWVKWHIQRKEEEGMSRKQPNPLPTFPKPAAPPAPPRCASPVAPVTAEELAKVMYDHPIFLEHEKLGTKWKDESDTMKEYWLKEYWLECAVHILEKYRVSRGA